MYCISCQKNNVTPSNFNSQSTEEEILWKNEVTPNSSININNQMIDNGIIHIIEAGYGSRHDGSKIIIAICDDCIDKNLSDGTILFFDDYMFMDKEHVERDINESKKTYRRRKNLDNLTDGNSQ